MDNILLVTRRSGVEKFFGSNWFLLLIAFIVLLFWSLSLTVVGLIILLCLFAFVLILSRSTFPAIPVLLCIFFVFSPEYTSLSGNEYLISFAAIPIIAVVLHFIIYKPKLRIRGFGVAVAVSTVPWLFQGLGRRVFYTVTDYFDPAFVWVAYLVLALLGLFYLALYVFFDSTCNQTGEKPSLYICKVMIFTAVIICIQCVIKIIRLVDEHSLAVVIGWLSTGTKIFMLGWATSNPLASYLSLTIPITFFAALRHDKGALFLYLFTVFQYAIVLLTFSRGPMIFVTAAMPFMLIYCFVKGSRKNRIQLGMALCLTFAVFILALSALFDKLKTLLSVMLDRGLGDNGRFNIYIEAWEVFKRYPILGGGMDVYFAFTEDAPWINELCNFRPGIPYWFHSTIAQTFAAFGIVGVIAYIYQYYARYRLAFRSRKNSTHLSIGIAMLLFDAYCVIDTSFYSPMMYLILLLLTLTLDKARIRPKQVKTAPNIISDCTTRNF